MEEKKLAFFVISTALGGAERSLLDFLVRFNKKPHTPYTVVTPKSEGPLIEEFKTHGIPYHTIAMPKTILKLSRNTPIKTLFYLIPSFFLIIRYFFTIRNWVKKENIQVIHSTGLKFHLLLGMIAMSLPIKLVIHLRDILKNPLYKYFFNFINEGANVTFIANSKATAKCIEKTQPEIIYNGFDGSEFNPAPHNELKSQLQVDQNSVLVGTVGALARWKGQREFLKMAKYLLSTKNDLHFVIVGSEIYDTWGERGERKRLEDIAKKYGIAGRVSFLDFQPNIQRVYNGLDIFVHCSIEEEPFGRVVVEAMLCGLPVIAPNWGGPAEIIRHRENGLLYPVGKIPKMAEMVKCLVNDQNLKETIAKNALDAEGHFTMEHYEQSLSKALQP